MDSEENPRMHKTEKKKKHANSSAMTHSEAVIQNTAGQEQASLSIVARQSRWTTERKNKTSDLFFFNIRKR